MAGGGMLFVRPSGKVLLLRRSSWVNNPRQWGIPGGQADKGESTINAAWREAQEELGLLPPNLEVIGSINIYRSNVSVKKTMFVVVICAAPKMPWVPNLRAHLTPAGYPENDSWVWIRPQKALWTLRMHAPAAKLLHMFSLSTLKDTSY